jgi:hypothetical protein
MAEPRVHIAVSRDDWRRVADRLEPGDVLALAPGEYVFGLSLVRGGTPDAPVVVRALDPLDPPRLVASDRGHVIDVRADDVRLQGLWFAPTAPSVHAIVLSGVSRVTIEACRFDGIGGLAIVQTMSGRGLVVRGNHIRDSKSTAMYFGCHEGSCAVVDVLVEQNHVDGVTAPRGAIGYGIQVKLNSTATLRDNVVRDTKGPAIMVYGCDDPAGVSVVEGNVVTASRRSSGIVVGGGPAIVRNNTAADHREAGIALEDYGRRGLLRTIAVENNTVYGNRRGGIMAPRRRAIEARITGNHVHARRGTPSWPVARRGLLVESNVDCRDGACHP